MAPTEPDAEPALQAFQRAMARAAAPGSAGFAGHRNDFERLMRSPFAADWVTARLHALTAGPATGTSDGCPPDMLAVRRTPRWTLCLRLTRADEPSPATVWGAAEDFVIGVPQQSQQPLRLTVHERPALEHRRPRLGAPRAVEIEPGCAVAFDPEADVVVLAPQPAPVVSALLTAPPRLAVRCSWHRESGHLDDVVAADPGASRLLALIPALVAAGSPEALPALHRLARHHAHFVRWQAVRAVFALDPVAGRHLLEQAACDPHPEVAEAADQALTLLADDNDRSRSSP
ncbi:HEAT repeat domain-containing protein [Streptomyces sp. NPDC002640]